MSINNKELSKESSSIDVSEESIESVVTNLLEAKPGRTNKIKRFWKVCKRHKLCSLTVLTVVVVSLLVCSPLRYQVMGLVISHDVSVIVVDSETNQPISEAEVSIKDINIKTDIDGKATFPKLKPGVVNVQVAKKYYDNYTTKITIGMKSPGDTTARIKANGRPVSVKALDAVSGLPISGALVESSETSTQTDQKGEATIVLPAAESKHIGKIGVANYNNQQVEIISQGMESGDNIFRLVPSGNLYFLSKKTGKIDLVKTNLDGSNRATIVPGTGNEDNQNTVLLVTTDWKYLAYIVRHDGENPKLYIIDTKTDTITEADGAPGVTVSAVGWSGHSFVYSLQRKKQQWESGLGALKSFDANSKQIALLEETHANGSNNYDYLSERISNVYILENYIFYTKGTDSSYGNEAPKKMGAYRVNTDGSNKVAIKEFDQKSLGNIYAILSEPEEIFISIYTDSQEYYIYKDGSFVLSKDLEPGDFNNESHPTYLASPDRQKTFWYESRDGKNSLFTGDKLGQNSSEIRSLSDLKPYGWFTDKYLLVSKDQSELYIIPSVINQAHVEQPPFKISDYHKPSTLFNGYGYGYGYGGQ